MALNDFLEPEVAIAAGVTAALASPKVRKTLRRGAVYAMAGLMIAGDKVSAATKDIARKTNLGRGAASEAAETAAEEGAKEAVEAAAG